MKEKESFLIDDIITWKDRAEFDKYIDTEGYFADNLNDLAWIIHRDDSYLLEECDYESTECFKPDEDDKYFSMFLPRDKVHYPEAPKARPFKNMEEFMEDTGLKVGDAIYLRNNNPDDPYVIRLITGLNDDAVILGHIPMYFDTLFENQIFSLDGHSWKGFVHKGESEIAPAVLSIAKNLIKNNMYKGNDPKIEEVNANNVSGYFFDDDDPESILKTILANPEALKSWQYGFLSVIRGELVRCVNINGEEFYYNYFIPESIVNKVRELCQK